MRHFRSAHKELEAHEYPMETVVAKSVVKSDPRIEDSTVTYDPQTIVMLEPEVKDSIVTAEPHIAESVATLHPVADSEVTLHHVTESDVVTESVITLNFKYV
jgi:hypothetical protein